MATAVRSRPTSDSYLRLVQQFPLRQIRADDENREALRIYRVVSSGRVDAGAREYLGVLRTLISAYEAKFRDELGLNDVTPAAIVAFLLEERGMSVNAFSKEIGIAQSSLSSMLNGKRGWSKSAIVKISNYFRLNPGLFLK